MNRENDYVNYFYRKYLGRVAIGVGYNENIEEIYPLVYETSAGESIGIVALDVVMNERAVVHIYHLGAFISGRGNGSRILKELCRQADSFNIHLSVSVVVMPSGGKEQMEETDLAQWYQNFGFKGEAGLLRAPARKNVWRIVRQNAPPLSHRFDLKVSASKG